MALTPEGSDSSRRCEQRCGTPWLVRPTPFDPATDRRVITLAMTTSTAFVLGGEIARLGRAQPQSRCGCAPCR